MHSITKNFAAVLVLVLVVLGSGCISSSENNSDHAPVTLSQPAPVLNGTTVEPAVWIHINPLDRDGDSAIISGTTNLSAGREIILDLRMELHSCPQDKPLFTWGRRDFCSKNCDYNPGQRTTHVLPGQNGENTWTFSVNTKDWCQGEHYWFIVIANNSGNVTRVMGSF